MEREEGAHWLESDDRSMRRMGAKEKVVPSCL